MTSKHAMTMKVTPEIEDEIRRVAKLSGRKLSDVKALVTAEAMTFIKDKVALLVRDDVQRALGFTDPEDVNVTVGAAGSLVDGTGLTLAESQRIAEHESSFGDGAGDEE